MNDVGPDGAKGVRYRPFPSFEEWSAEPYDGAALSVFEDQLMEARASADEDAVRKALETATRWAAVDTGALEGLYEVDRGFTYSVAVEVAVIDTIRLEKGSEVARAVEDALSTYEGILDAATKSAPVTEAWIRSLHSSICASQDTYTIYTSVDDGKSVTPQERPLPKGEYKTESNSPWNRSPGELHAYAPPLDTGPEMKRLTTELRSERFLGAHPVVQASYAHYAFVAVHPFADGNGRVARALASVFLYRRPGIPLVIFADQKGGYLDALEAADGGQFGVFTRYIGERTIDAVQMVRDVFSAGSSVDLNKRMVAINEMLTDRGGLEHKELDALAARLIGEWTAALDTETPEQKLAPIRISLSALGAGGGAPSEALRVVSDARGVQLSAGSSGPGSANVNRSYRVFVARPGVDGADVVIAKGKRVVAEAFIRDLNPTISQSLQFRLRNLARGEIGGLLDDLQAAVDRKLREQGYR